MAQKPNNTETPKPRSRTERLAGPGKSIPSGAPRDVQVGGPQIRPPRTDDDGKPLTVPKEQPPAAFEASDLVHEDPQQKRVTTPSAVPQELTGREIITLKLFSSFHEGAGYGDATPLDRIDPTQGSVHYNRSHGSIDARMPGQIQAGQRIVKVAATNHDLNPVFAIEWTDTNGIYPAIFYIVGKKLMKVRFGAVSEVLEGAVADMKGLATNNATGGMFDDDGSGIPYLYACFGSAQNIVRMNLAQAFTLDTSGVKAGLLLSLNGDAYRTEIPTGGTVHSQVSKCPRGADRFDETAWGDGVTVGFAGTQINTLTSIRNAPVAIKPEGVFAFNAGVNRWVNYTPSWRSMLHLQNGLGAYHIGDVLIIPMGDGSTMMFDGNSVRPFDPGGPMATPNRHTTRDNFSSGAMCAMRHWLIGVTGPNAKIISAGSSLEARFYDDSLAAYTDGSANVRDNDLTTELAFTIAEAADALYIGWHRPFTSMELSMGTGNNNVATPTVAIGTVEGTPPTFTSIGAKNTGFRDFTELAGAPLGQSGMIALMVDPVEAGWVPTTINGSLLYWVRISFSAALDAITILNLKITPWYPSIDATNFPLDGLDRSGILPHLMYGRVGTNGQPWFHDIGSLPEPDHISQALFANVGGTNVNHPRRVLMIGRFAVWAIDVADNDRPGTEAEPFLNSVGLIESTSFIPIPGKVVRLHKVRINGHEFDPDVATFFYYAWEWGHPWSRASGQVTTVPAVINRFSKEDRGNRFRWAWGFTTSDVNVAKPTIPIVTDIEVDFEVLPDSPDSLVERPMQDEPRF